ncbi:MAG: hypothetical protein J5855_05925 [Mailhella sp.]|nr:hypothetical protein [Mailhella sp.]
MRRETGKCRITHFFQVVAAAVAAELAVSLAQQMVFQSFYFPFASVVGTASQNMCNSAQSHRFIIFLDDKIFLFAYHACKSFRTEHVAAPRLHHALLLVMT